jgi:hypothetical protein
MLSTSCPCLFSPVFQPRSASLAGCQRILGVGSQFIRAAGFQEVEVLSCGYVKISEAAEWKDVKAC